MLGNLVGAIPNFSLGPFRSSGFIHTALDRDTPHLQVPSALRHLSITPSQSSQFQASPLPKMPSPTFGRNHSPETRTKIVEAYQSGLSAKEVAVKYDITPRAVRAMAERYKGQKDGHDRPRSGRPPILDERQKRHILRLIKQNPLISNQELLERIGRPCSMQSVTRWLKTEGVHCRKVEMTRDEPTTGT